MLRKIYIERLWKIEEKTASHHYHATKERCRKKRFEIWRWTAERKTPRLILEKPCLRKARHAVSDSSDAESGIAGIEINILYTDAWASNAYAYCNIEDVTGKPSTHLKASVLILKPTEKSLFAKCLTTRRRLIEISSLVCWTSLFYCLINQSQFADAGVCRGEQNGVLIAGVPFLLSPIPFPFFSYLLLFFLTLPHPRPPPPPP